MSDATSIAALYQTAVQAVSPPITVDEHLCSACQFHKSKRKYAVDAGRWHVSDCEQCGTGQLLPLPSAAEIGSFYPASYYGDTGNKFESLIELFVRLVAARQAWFLARRVPKGGRVLDIGCGRGVLLRALADQGFEAHGIEISAAAALGADARCQIRICNSMQEAHYPAAYFDEVVLWHVLEHLPNPREVLTEVHRVLKPGGRLVIAVPNYSSWQSRWTGASWFHLDLPRHLFHFTRHGLQQLYQEMGFAVESEHHFSLRQNPFGWIQSWQNQLAVCGWWPRNALYTLLLKHSGVQVSSWYMSLLLRACAGLMLPAALILSVFEALARQGGTMHFVGRRIDNQTTQPIADSSN